MPGKAKKTRSSAKLKTSRYKCNPGNVLLSHNTYDCSTIGDEELNDRVRNGNGCGLLSMVTGKYFG